VRPGDPIRDRRLDGWLRRVAPPRVGPFREGAYRSGLHSERIAAWLGIALGVTFVVCFVTGVISHLIQHPVSWFSWPARPAWLYRVNQGLHVATGIAAIPLLLVKLWVVSPRLWTWPPFRSIGHLLERVSLLPLVGGSIFLLFTGIASINYLRPWGFSFPAAHYSAAWITIGALVVHVGAKLHVAACALAKSDDRSTDAGVQARVGALAAQGSPHDAPVTGLTRRGLLGAAFAGVVAVTLATVGQTVGSLRRLAVLAPRDPTVGPQGVPVNRTARAAGVEDAATSPDYRLSVEGDVPAPRSFSLEELRALPQREAVLAITCVDGWSAVGVWRGVSVPDLLSLVGASTRATAEIVSLQREGAAYGASLLDASHAADPDTLLALELNGEPLALDHGFPARLIAPNRPGVMQTKWVARVIVT
jgi:DMSO/TMAO reductase YedYZ molybdopterin-dependent catalytic subunit